MPCEKFVSGGSLIMKTGETTLNQDCVAILNTAAAGQCKRPTGSAQTTDRVVGVLKDLTHAAGATQQYQSEGICLVAIAAAVSIGDRLVIADVAGQVRKMVEAADAGADIVGVAQTANTTAGSKVYVQLTPNQIVHS